MRVTTPSFLAGLAPGAAIVVLASIGVPGVAVAAQLAKVQAGWVDMGSSSSTTVSLNSLLASGNNRCDTGNCGTVVDRAKTMLIFQPKISGTAPGLSSITGELTDSNTLVFRRIGMTNAPQIKWYLAEFASGVTVQHGTASLTDLASVLVDITDVDPAKSFPLITTRTGGVNYGDDDWFRARLIEDGGRLEISAIKAQASTGSMVAYQVVQFTSGAAVEAGDVTMASGATNATAAVSCPDVSKCWLLYTYTAESGVTTNTAQKMVRGLISSPTQVTFDRDDSGTAINISYHLVKFSDGTVVHHGSEDFPAGTNFRTRTIPSVSLTQSIAVAGAWMKGARTGDTTSGNVGAAFTRLDLKDATTLELARGTGTGTASVGWFVVQFATNATAVRMAEMDAVAAADGPVTLRWRTGWEIDNLGFHVWRETDRGRIRLTDGLIAGGALLRVGTPAAGRWYSFRDLPVAGGTRYWIEDVALDGTRTLHGPVPLRSVEATPIQAVTSALLSEPAGTPNQNVPASVENQGLWPGSTAPLADLGAHLRMMGGPAIKLVVSRSGWYQVPIADLVRAGLPADADPRRIAVFVDGHEQAVHLEGEQDGRLDPADLLQFHARAPVADEPGAGAHWVVVGQSPGRRLPPPAVSAPVPPPESFPMTVQHRDRSFYFAALRNGPASNLFGAVIERAPVLQALQVHHLVPGPARVEVALQGVSEGGHEVELRLAGERIGVLRFDGRAHATGTFAVPFRLLREGENPIELRATGPAPDVSLVDHVRLTYAHRPVIGPDEDATVLRLPAGTSLAVETVDPKIVRAFDVTDETNPRPLVVEGTAGHARVQVVAPDHPSGTPRLVTIVTPGSVRAPGQIVPHRPAPWRDPPGGADLIVIGPSDLLAALDPLVEARSREGWRVLAVPAEALYDVFAFGRQSPEAIRAFMRSTRTWTRAPRALLLVGDASFDPRDHLGRGGERLPTALVDTDALETASDDALVDFDADGIADVAVGRLPVRTVGQATALARRLAGHRPASGGEVVVVTDRDDRLGFTDMGRAVGAAVPPGRSMRLLARGGIDDGALRAAVRAAWAAGPAVLAYVGHGSVDAMGDDLLRVEDLALPPAGLSGREPLPRPARPPLVLSLSCLNGFFQDAFASSLGEELLEEPAGALAVIASSGLTQAASQVEFGREVMRRALTGEPLGEAVREAKRVARDPDVRRSFLLLGDPTARIAPAPEDEASGAIPVQPRAGCEMAPLRSEPGGGAALLVSVLGVLRRLRSRRRGVSRAAR